MRVETFLHTGSGAGFAEKLRPLTANALDALLLFSLGADHAVLRDAVKGVGCRCYLTETYGILGYDDDQGRNVEYMEKGRGSEYGFVGGSGGQGVLAVAYSGGGVSTGHEGLPPPDARSALVVADTSGAWKSAAAAAETVPTHYGGITKEAWELKEDGSLHAVPYFWVASTADAEPTGLLATQDAVGQATAALLQKLPPALAPSGAVGAFPCFTRGVNQYGAEHVEPDELSAALPGVRLYGMFAHGELGPSAFAGFAGADTPAQPCTQHSMHTVLAVHTTASVKEEL